MKNSSVFISYRRSDSAATAGRIKDNLEKYLPQVKVFMDVDSIGGGEDFKSKISQSIANSDMMLVLIGPHWVENSDGVNRMQDADDFVRLEVASALAAGIKVFPILLDDCRMPSSTELPNDIQAITTLNALEIRHSRFNDDLKHSLIKIFDLPERTFRGTGAWDYAKATLLGLGAGAITLFLIAFLNKLLLNKALNEVLGSELTIALLVAVPLLSITFFIRRILR
ncbi:MAG: toll/interleukin-1 receptor domain-containing protein [Gammaproteobacteria bacterium]|nr:toll/interleukin-1 receptor domain-containing protein [Gammaproteobacteria bacterium]NVK88367.1 toll/interleukin-1 receptor domain-containing protein [Gammaproteobacteria bacterium]